MILRKYCAIIALQPLSYERPATTPGKSWLVLLGNPTGTEMTVDSLLMNGEVIYRPYSLQTVSF